MIHEIEKLASFKEGNKKVTINDIKRIAAENNVFDVYALSEYICHRERAKAIKALRVLLESRKNHSFIIWHLDNFLSKVAVAKLALNAGESDEAAAAKAGIRYYKEQYINNARIVRDDLIMEAPARIFNADRLMKRGLPEGIILEKLICELT
jgi:DNA polymerase III delta subunit